MTRSVHEQEDWPHFYWDQESIFPLLAAARPCQGKLLGQMKSLGFALQEEAVLQTLTEDVVQSSIEGEILDKAQVRSSLARRLGLDAGALLPADRSVEGVAEMLLDATQRYAEPLLCGASVMRSLCYAEPLLCGASDKGVAAWLAGGPLPYRVQRSRPYSGGRLA